MKIIVTFLFVLLLSITTIAQRVSPYQAGSYYPGLANLRDFAAVPAGLFILDYNYSFNSHGYYDKNGNRFTGSSIDIEDYGLIDFTINPTLSGYANVPVIFYASKFKILGGARYLASISPIYMSIDYDVLLDVGNTSGSITGNISGLGDLSFMPLGLSWSFDKKIDLSFMYTVYAPTGKYKTGADDNLGQGFWTHQIQLPTYFYALEKATAIAIIPTLELNGGITDANARAGNRFSLEYGVSQYLTEWLEIELTNAHNWQISDDTGKDIWWDNTPFDTKDSKNVFSTGIGIWPGVDWLNIHFKYITDYSPRQRFQNHFFSCSLILIPNVLTDNDVH